jgi:hypothetical protein
VSFAANELVSLAVKAAIGAGVPPGQAQDFGQAVLFHVNAGRNSAEIITALAHFPNGPVLALPIALSRLIETAEEDVAQGTLHLGSFSELTKSYVESRPVKSTLSVIGTQARITFLTNQPAQMRPAARLYPDERLIETLRSYASKTLVPETDASRKSGAGAQTTDND